MSHSKLSLYKKFSELKEEILKHKWIESEKANQDIGFENALLDWMQKHRLKWVEKDIDNKT